MTHLYAPEMVGSHELRRVRTRAGIVIGGAYVPRPPLPSADAEHVQRALLSRIPTRPTLLERLRRWLLRL
jgi:hypothetical protein